MRRFTFSLLLLMPVGLMAQKSPGFYDKVFYVISNESNDSLLVYPGSRKNSLSLQLGGDTPYIGIKYSRRVYLSETGKKSIEAGIGLGLAPHLFYSGAKHPSSLSFSHHTTLLFRSHKFISLYASYSGVFYSYTFYRDKKYNYLPAPSFGLRMGEFERFSVDLFLQTYFYRQLDYRIKEENILQTFDSQKVFYAPGLSLTIPFK